MKVKNMYIIERINKKGEKSYLATERYKDPLTGKTKRASITFRSNTARGRKQAENDLSDRIDELIRKGEAKFDGTAVTTFGQLRENWLETWQLSVKRTTVEREKLVLKIISDDFLLERITPLLVKKCLDEYQKKYHSTHSTMQHIKCTLNKIFDYGVLYNLIPFSPSRVIKLSSTHNERVEKKKRLEKKFLNEQEIFALLSELTNRRNQNYYDLALFLLGTGCRIGEASALTLSDIDFKRKTVNISKSLQAHDLRVDEFYLDSTKTEAGERIEELPDFVIEALKHVIERNAIFDENMDKEPEKSFRHSEFLFRTEYGAPITSHSFREILTRVNKTLVKHCEERYGFKWAKNAVPHSFRHIHISILRNDPSVPTKEVQKRVGHVREETTNGYTHLMSESQEKSVEAIDRFAEKLGIAI